VTHVAGEAKPHQQIDEVRSGGGYFSQNDLRVHFGIGAAEKVAVLEIRWPSGQFDTLKDLKPNRLYYVTESQGITRTEVFPPAKRA
jgi:enediyne biosynthesis protein E4